MTPISPLREKLKALRELSDPEDENGNRAEYDMKVHEVYLPFILALSEAVDALESVAAAAFPTYDTEEYWRGLGVVSTVAYTLAEDTRAAREALKQIETILRRL